MRFHGGKNDLCMNLNCEISYHRSFNRPTRFAAALFLTRGRLSGRSEEEGLSTGLCCPFLLLSPSTVQLLPAVLEKCSFLSRVVRLSANPDRPTLVTACVTAITTTSRTSTEPRPPGSDGWPTTQTPYNAVPQFAPILCYIMLTDAVWMLRRSALNVSRNCPTLPPPPLHLPDRSNKTNNSNNAHTQMGAPEYRHLC
jgi:hypothetical protein